ncbi:MAG TPA: fatty acid desaturase [Anaerolineales bacterium]|nr:fatty acid desaturase [Anaerolineales bacterium]
MRQSWVAELKRFEQPNSSKATFQVVNTLIPYIAILGMMYLTISWKVHYGITILLALPASLFLVRLFIFFHDCAHGSYVASRRATKVLGTVLGIIVFMPFFEWRSLHARHHATSGNLDNRGKGDIWTMTVDEYNHSSWFRRLLYRMFRNPLVMFGLGPLYIFLIAHRLPSRGANREAIFSVIFLNAVLIAIVIVAELTISIECYVKIQLPILFMAGAVGVWLFYIQHQFDPSYWSRKGAWNHVDAALRGSSFYKLPKLLQWFSGNIGLHHIHHLRPRIPNYLLEQCQIETPELQCVKPVTLSSSLKAVRLNLWDEQRGLFVSFREAALRTKETSAVEGRLSDI